MSISQLPDEQSLPLTLAGLAEPIDGLREAGQLFHSRGWSVGTSSNYSVVLQGEPLELLVTASGKDKGRLRRSDFVRVGADGRPEPADQPKASAETMLHVVLAERGDVGAILHTHSVWGTLLSNCFFERGSLRIAGYEMLKGLEGIKTHDTSIEVPIFENTQDIPALADEVKRRLLDAAQRAPHGFLIRRHGLYTWGRDLEEARRHIEVFEFLFECVARDLMLNRAATGL
ncbi:MAG: methylthioribulose 1-phosphate dehydratase [Pirellulaceae bacterium]|jgi:methylthioribulose-1-phosphate dehydratase|nr:methylthioribulose 1-phosphate dehydratase [Pirellulaceae bacterium]